MLSRFGSPHLVNTKCHCRNIYHCISDCYLFLIYASCSYSLNAVEKKTTIWKENKRKDSKCLWRDLFVLCFANKILDLLITWLLPPIHLRTHTLAISVCNVCTFVCVDLFVFANTNIYICVWYKLIQHYFIRSCLKSFGACSGSMSFTLNKLIGTDIFLSWQG